MQPAQQRKSALIAAFAAAFLALSCASKPATPIAAVTEPATSTAPAEPIQQANSAQTEPVTPTTKVEVPPEPAHFDPTAVTEEVKTATFVDARSLIETLNEIIRKKDYAAWLRYLADDYIAYYSDPKVLADVSEQPALKPKGIKLNTLQDYFLNVVYPSHQYDKIDDIEFVDENTIKAITVRPNGDRPILYMLEKHGDAWKIGIGRQ